MAAVFIGTGVGPGDPNLLTVKAWRAISTAEVISYIANEHGVSQAKNIAREALAANSRAPLEIPVKVPMCEDRRIVNRVYDEAASRIKEYLQQGRQVVFLCEGDPLFFGSFAYLLERIQTGHSCQVIPGISSVHAASAALRMPLTILKESFVVVSGRHTDQQLSDALLHHDTVVIMKAGRARPRILAALASTGRAGDARYLEYIGRDNERVVSDITTLENASGPYFSLFIVARTERDQT